MAFSLGSLLATASSARAGARRGQREQQMQDAEAERQQRMDTFNEYARSRQLAQTDNAQQNAQERLRDQIEAKEIIAARNAELQGKNVEINDYKAREAAAAAREKMIRETGQDPLNPTQGYRGADRSSREGMNREDNETSIANTAARAAAAAAAAAIRANQPKPRQIPTPVANAYLGNQKQVRIIEDAIKQLTDNPNAVGVKGFLPGAVLDRLPGKGGAAGVDARAAVADIGSLEIRDRSGAAVTASEFPRLRPFIPSDRDDSATALKKLRRMAQIIAEETEAMAGFYSADQGYVGMPGAPPSGAAASAGSGDSGQETPAQRAARLKAKAGVP